MVISTFNLLSMINCSNNHIQQYMYNMDHQHMFDTQFELVVKLYFVGAIIFLFFDQFWIICDQLLVIMIL